MPADRDCYVMAYVEDILFLGERRTVNKIFEQIRQHLFLRRTGTLQPSKTVPSLKKHYQQR